VHRIVKLWTKFLIIGVLLILSLSGTVYAARATLGAVHSFTVQQTLSKNGDVHTILSWMTLPYIARTYHVPASYLDVSLGLNVAKKPRLYHATLHEIATYFKQSDTEIVYRVQKAILNYRHNKPPDKPEFTPTAESKKVLVKPVPTPTVEGKKVTVRLKPTPKPKSKKHVGRATS
jgi:hypothetical protein